MNDIKDKFPQNVRTSINRYRDYYYRILIYRMSNIFKCSYKESIKRVSQKIKVFGRKFFIQKSCEFFEVDYDDSLYIKDLKLRELTRTLKVLPTPKEIIKQRNEKRIQTNIERYGYKTAFSLKETQDKVKKTFNEKYGGNTPMKDDKVKQKVKDTTFQRYGVTNCMNLEHVDHNYNYENIKKTVKEKYGVENVFQLEEVKEKIKNTNLEKYGVECYTKTAEYKEKSKDTCLEKYGVDNYSKTDEYKMDYRKLHNKRYGKRQVLKYRINLFKRCLHFYSLEDTIKLFTKFYDFKHMIFFLKCCEVENPKHETYKVFNKIFICKNCGKEFLHKKDNVKFCSNRCSNIYNQKNMSEESQESRRIKCSFKRSEETKEKQRASHIGRDYTISNEKNRKTKLQNHGDPNYNNREKYHKTCLERYGVNSYLGTEEFKNISKQTSLEKYGVENPNQRHFKNLDDLNEEFFRNNFIKDNRFLVDECCLYFNFSSRAADDYKEKFNITEINKSNHLKTQQYIFDSINTENKFFNDRHLIKELDIYIPDYNLAIEYDGLMYHSEGYTEYPMFKNTEKTYHLEKTELCLKNNIQLFHIFEGEDLDLWLSMINNKLGLNEKIYARKCIIKELNSQETVEFLNENHLQGFCQAKINVGLFYNNELVSVMTFSKPRFNKKYEYELIRFCSKRNTSVIGGATKLWKYFVTKYNPNSVITYANRRFSNGEIYKTLGFTFLEKTSPNYFYFKGRSRELFSRVKFQKHKLKELLDVYDENLSEAENMFNNNYRRIYDCGNLKFEYRK